MRPVPEQDLVRLYLTEIGRHPLIEQREEAELARAIEEGHTASLRLERLNPGNGRAGAELIALRAAVERASLARVKFTQANLRLVVSIARRYQGSGLPLLDLIQEGNIGLMRAIEKFDWRRGFKFSTYATWWIRQAISRGLADTARTIRLPAHVVEALQRLRTTEERLLDVFGREPTDDEVAAALEVGVSEVHRLRRWRTDPASLHAQISEDADTELHELIRDDSAVDPVDAAVATGFSDELRRALERLPDRERRILEMRFGFHDGEARTLSEIGAVLGVTRERIRQLQMKAMVRLRHASAGPAARMWSSL